MRGIILAVFLMWLPATLSAQPISVQTGEHDGFTRVVVRLPAGREWQFGRGADGYLLRMPATQGYDLRRFFDLIPRTRITGVEQGKTLGELRFLTDCACRADAFVIEPGFLVIDFMNGVADPEAPFEKQMEVPLGVVLAPPSITGAGVLPVIFPRASEPRAFPAIPMRSTFAMEAPGQPTMPSLAKELDALERLVVESLGRGLSAGMLAPDIAPGLAAPARPLQRAPDLHLPGIAVSSGLNPAAIPGEEQPAVNAEGVACIPDNLLDLAAWADDRPFGDQIANMRSGLVQEFDRFDPQVIVEMARLYLHFGFGREAVQTLEMDNVRSQERGYLRLLAEIIDEDAISFPDIRRQLTCPSRIALWAFLAEADRMEGGNSQRAAILRAFKELPMPLQRHLGPRLAERFVSVGDNDAGYQALSVALLGAPDAIETRMAAATLDRQLGNDITALQTLTEIAQTSARITPDAMIRFLTEAARQMRSVSDGDMVIADALRFENALTPVAGDLAAVQVEVYLAADAFGDAARLMVDERIALGDERYARIQIDYGLAAATRMTDTDFLVFAFAKPTLADAHNLQYLVASRLISLGFPDHALRVLADAGPVEQQDERTYLRSIAFLSLQDPESVVRILREDVSERANDLRQAAQALRAGQNWVPENLTALDETERSWRNGDWSSLVHSDDPLLKAAGAAVLDTDNPTRDDQMPLASGRALLGQAGQSRLLLDELLERFATPGDF